MNQRIQELSEQAQLYARQGMAQSVIKGLDADTMSEKYAKDFEEKFAELIVKECCDWIEGSPTSESGCQLLLTKSFIIANLKGHFGV